MSYAIECKDLSEALETFYLSPLILQKMKEDSIGLLGDMKRHSVNNNTHMGLVISLCPNSNQMTS